MSDGITDSEKGMELPKEVKPRPRMQYVFITIADGRRGVFAGPELITKGELILKPPVLSDVIFSEPREVESKKEETIETTKETPNK